MLLAWLYRGYDLENSLVKGACPIFFSRYGHHWCFEISILMEEYLLNLLFIIGPKAARGNCWLLICS